MATFKTLSDGLIRDLITMLQDWKRNRRNWDRQPRAPRPVVAGGGSCDCPKYLYRIKYQTNASFGSSVVRINVGVDNYDATLSFDETEETLLEKLKIGPFDDTAEDYDPEFTVAVDLDGSLGGGNAALVRFEVPAATSFGFWKLSQSATTFFMSVTKLGKVDPP